MAVIAVVVTVVVVIAVVVHAITAMRSTSQLINTNGISGGVNCGSRNGGSGSDNVVVVVVAIMVGVIRFAFVMSSWT